MHPNAADNPIFNDNLSSVFAVLIKNKEQQREIDDQLALLYKTPRGTLNELLINESIMENWNEVQLCILVIVLHNVIRDERINPFLFFSQRQINKAMKYRWDEKAEVYPLVFQRVLALPTGREFLTYLSYKQVFEMYNNKSLTYNFDTQRLSKKKLKTDGSFSEKIDIKQQSVRKIVELMEEDKYKPDTIVFNILVDGDDRLEYDADGLTLTVHQGTTINLIDGMHRVQAIIHVMESNPNKEGYIEVAIKHYPLAEAQFALGQFNCRNTFDKTLVKHYMGEDFSSQITKELMYIPELKHKISIKTTLDKKLNYFTNYSILAEAIEAIFQPHTSKERYDVTEVLKKFFGYLIASYANEFTKNHIEVAKTSWINHHNTYVGYVVIAKKLYDKYGKNYPVDEIIRIVDGINFSKKQSAYNDLMVQQGKVNSNQMKIRIRKFFEEQTHELLNN